MSDAYLVVSSARLRVPRTPFSQVAQESDAQHIGPLDHRTGKTMHLWYIARPANTKRGCGTVICPCSTSLAGASSKTTRHYRYFINILSHIQRRSSTDELVLSVLDPGAAVISSMLSFVPNNPALCEDKPLCHLVSIGMLSPATLSPSHYSQSSSCLPSSLGTRATDPQIAIPRTIGS